MIADKWSVVVLYGLSEGPRVDYDLTELGRTLMEPIRMLTTWAALNGEAVLAAQESA